MIAVVLVHPEIPPNTGNIIRLCANTGAQLHLVEPMGFRWEDRAVKRAGLDYHEFAEVRRHKDWQTCLESLAGRRLFAITTKGKRHLYEQTFEENDAFVFGSETAGLPQEIMETFSEEARLRLPMREGQRSLNLSNAVAIASFEAWRQLGFPEGV